MPKQRRIEGYEPDRRRVRLSHGKTVDLTPRQGKVFEGWLLGLRSHRRLAEFMTLNSGTERKTAKRDRSNASLEAFTENEIAAHLSRIRSKLRGLIPKLRGEKRNTQKR